MASSRPKPTDEQLPADLSEEANILRQEIALQELLVRQLQQRKAVRDEMLQRLRAAMHTSDTFDFEELTSAANELLQEIEDSHKKEEVSKAQEEQRVDVVVAETALDEGANGLTMDELLGVEEGGHKKKRKRNRNKKKKKQTDVDTNQHVDPTAMNEETNKTYTTSEEKKEAAQRAALFAALESVHFEDHPNIAPSLHEEGPAWLHEEEAPPPPLAEEEYSDDFEDCSEEETEEATKDELQKEAEEEKKEDISSEFEKAEM